MILRRSKSDCERAAGSDLKRHTSKESNEELPTASFSFRPLRLKSIRKLSWRSTVGQRANADTTSIWAEKESMRESSSCSSDKASTLPSTRSDVIRDVHNRRAPKVQDRSNDQLSVNDSPRLSAALADGEDLSKPQLTKRLKVRSLVLEDEDDPCNFWRTSVYAMQGDARIFGKPADLSSSVTTPSRSDTRSSTTAATTQKTAPESDVIYIISRCPARTASPASPSMNQEESARASSMLERSGYDTMCETTEGTAKTLSHPLMSFPVNVTSSKTSPAETHKPYRLNGSAWGLDAWGEAETAFSSSRPKTFNLSRHSVSGPNQRRQPSWLLFQRSRRSHSVNEPPLTAPASPSSSSRSSSRLKPDPVRIYSESCPAPDSNMPSIRSGIWRSGHCCTVPDPDALPQQRRVTWV
ncbi:hypothetical protein BCV70DRAFT_197721 [Testicularia cyperi]|uniref:Uncharacterized protein n=1 Tax=Testicularia cyperi TaxID=1882483 RepID=A0A317Y1S0_9BASI|nr:hypothetical protein BCV70DRAFT_197721 [Testicularia cyperi]